MLLICAIALGVVEVGARAMELVAERLRDDSARGRNLYVEVRNPVPVFELAFNLYLARLVQAENLAPGALRFTGSEDLGTVEIANSFVPFYPARSQERFRGLILIEPPLPPAP